MMRNFLSTAVVLFSATCTAQETAKEYRIAGVLVNSVTNQPFSKTRVSIGPADRRDEQVWAITTAEGRFQFEHVKEGKYRLAAEPRGLPRQTFGQPWLYSAFGIAVVTGAGLDTQNLVFRINPVSFITGKVIDDDGEPVRSALIELLRASVVNGRRRVGHYLWDWTNDLGEYRFTGLAAGSYYLAVTGHPWYSDRQFFSTGSGGDPMKLAYQPCYYPNARDPASAAPIELKAGQEIVANFNVTPVPGATVTVQVGNLGRAQGTVQLTGEGVASNRAFYRVEHLAAVQRLGGIPPGHYTVRATIDDGTRTLSASQPVEVNNADITVQLTPAELPTVTGSVQVENVEPKLLAKAIVSIRDELTGTSYSRRIGSGGSFSIQSVHPGSYRVSLTGAGLFLKSVVVGKIAVEDTVFEVSETGGVPLQLIVEEASGHIDGKVLEAGKPYIGAFLFLAPRDDLKSTGVYRAFETDGDGSYYFDGIPSGEYVLFGVKNGQHLEYRNRAAIKKYMEAGRAVHVESKSSQTIGIDLIP